MNSTGVGISEYCSRECFAMNSQVLCLHESGLSLLEHISSVLCGPLLSPTGGYGAFYFTMNVFFNFFVQISVHAVLL
jgi:hypothetical protein